MPKQAQLDRYLKYWQKKLGLLNWDIELIWLPKDEPVSAAYACVYTDVLNRVARARVAPLDRLQGPDVSSDFKDTNLLVYEPEHSVIHELLHLVLHEYRLSAVDDTETGNLLFERFINTMATTLTAMPAKMRASPAVNFLGNNMSQRSKHGLRTLININTDQRHER